MTDWASRKTGQARGLRRGSVFGVRLTSEERCELESLRGACAGPEGLGPWMVWAALRAFRSGVLPRRREHMVLPELVVGGGVDLVIPGRGTTSAGALSGTVVVPARAVVLDLCGGSGAWSEPYRRAGYDVRVVSLPAGDVRTFVPTGVIHGVLCAPPCDQFSLARNGDKSPRDFLSALEVVAGCLRIVGLARPLWWAMENPVGYLGRWMGTPVDVFEPYEFGDPWTKRTALWGRFSLPERGPFVEAVGSAMDRSSAAERAVTPPGFASAFFRANP